MTGHDRYAQELKRLYKERRISVVDFACCHQKSCKKAAAAAGRALTMGAEAHVGNCYGDPIRVVFVSLDTGGGEFQECGENLEARQRNIESQRYEETNRHMRGTIDVLRSIYEVCQEELLLPRIAMINSAKCAGRDRDKSVVPTQLYRNCREHGIAELNALDPKLIVAQGARARELMSGGYVSNETIEARIPQDFNWCDVDVRSWILNLTREYLRIFKYKNSEAIVLQTPHPSARNGQWQRFLRLSLPPLSHVIRHSLIPRLAEYEIPTNDGSTIN